MGNRLGTALAAVTAWACATTAVAQVSLDLRATAPASPDAVATWVAARPGPFRLL